MTPYKKEKRNIKLKNVKRSAYIKYRLTCQGLSVKNIIEDLDITRQAVYRSFFEQSKISRVDKWLADHNII